MRYTPRYNAHGGGSNAYACVWGIIGDYVYTYVTSYPREEAY